METDILIIGGGITGIYLANKLSKHQHDFILVESNQTIGGRLKTDEHNGIYFDGGGQFISPNHTVLIKLINKLDLQFDDLLYDSGKILINGKLYDDILSDDIINSLVEFDEKIDIKDEDDQYKRISVNDYLKSCNLDDITKSIIRICCNSYIYHPNDVSMFTFIEYVRKNGGIVSDHMFALSQKRLKKGMQSLIDKLSDNKFDNSNIIVNFGVNKIVKLSNNKFDINDGQIICNQIVFTGNPVDILKIQIDFLPNKVFKTCSLLKSCSLKKIFVVFKQRYWIDLGNSGQAYHHDSDIMCIDDTRILPDGSMKPMLLFFASNSAYENPYPFIFSVLSQIVGDKPYEYMKEENWSNSGCVTYLPTLKPNESYESLEQKYDNFYFAGTYFGLESKCNIDGAIRSIKQIEHIYKNK